MTGRPRTVAEAFGAEAADELARWAIDVLCNGQVPEKQNAHAYAAKVPWTLVHEGRAVLERAGFDWRAAHARQREQYREAAARSDVARRARKIAEQA
jgi:hypothetical protein